MPVLASKQHKNRKIRYTEYYDMQNLLDRLFAESASGRTFNSLMDIITSRENITMAYRTIKGNKGSKTPGVDKRNIDNLAKMSEDKFVALIRKQFNNYHPHPVKRVEIPKPNGKLRPLGIPTIVDRIVQQCILQVLEPICEAKFHERSNGFRPNRSAENAVAQCCRLIQVQHMHYVVDIDIKGFFDNVSHGKLIRQMWNMGIRDKKLICIIKQMLKAPVILPDQKKILPDKGTPQGGILSPLLSNIVLNELDWWIASQWENMPTHHNYKHPVNKQGTEVKSHTYRALRKSNLKEMHIVRYADDFKIFCPDRQTAERAFLAVKLWLKDRLKLDISPEKSKIVNLRQHYSEFLGFKLKAKVKCGKYVVSSFMSDKAKQAAKQKITECVKAMKHPPNQREQYKAIQQYNSVVAGLHNYYKFATNVNLDFADIAFGIKTQLNNRLKEITTDGVLKRGFIQEKYGKSKQLRFLNGHPLIPVGYVRTQNARHKKKSVNRYTSEGRSEIHKDLRFDTSILLWLMQNPVLDKSIEFADNRISLYAAQYGKCAVTGEHLMPYDIRCHHKIPLEHGGTDDYDNLVLVKESVHILIHTTNQATINGYVKLLNLNKKQLEKVNQLRKLAETKTL